MFSIQQSFEYVSSATPRKRQKDARRCQLGAAEAEHDRQNEEPLGEYGYAGLLYDRQRQDVAKNEFVGGGRSHHALGDQAGQCEDAEGSYDEIRRWWFMGIQGMELLGDEAERGEKRSGAYDSRTGGLEGEASDRL